MPVDAFYTVPKIAQKCCRHLDFSRYDNIIEPSAGSGSFLPYLPERTLAYDLDPMHSDVRQLNFFDYVHTMEGTTLVVGNPPFGVQSNLAVKFFNHAAQFADTIAMIFPATFRKSRLQNRLDLGFRVKKNIMVPKGSFYPPSMQARCVFQVWDKAVRRRTPFVAPVVKDFWRCDANQADIAIKAAGGSGDCGTIIKPDEVVNPKAYHFLGVYDSSVVDKLRELPYYPLASWSVRQDSISLDEIKYLYHRSN